MPRVSRTPILLVLATLLRLSVDFYRPPPQGGFYPIMRELKLNIYDNKHQVIKTYTSTDVFISTGIVEDLFKVIDIDKFLSKNNDADTMGRELIKIIFKGWDNFKEIILQVFDGITEDEFKHTDLAEINVAIMYILQNALSSLNGIGTNEKN